MFVYISYLVYGTLCNSPRHYLQRKRVSVQWRNSVSTTLTTGLKVNILVMRYTDSMILWCHTLRRAHPLCVILPQNAQPQSNYEKKIRSKLSIFYETPGKYSWKMSGSEKNKERLRKCNGWEVMIKKKKKAMWDLDWILKWNRQQWKNWWNPNKVCSLINNIVPMLISWLWYMHYGYVRCCHYGKLNEWYVGNLNTVLQLLSMPYFKI